MLDLAAGAGHRRQRDPEARRAGRAWWCAFGPRRLRAVTHLDVSAADIDQAIEIIADVLR